jgi:hypothetical protein
MLLRARSYWSCGATMPRVRFLSTRARADAVRRRHPLLKRTRHLPSHWDRFVVLLDFGDSPARARIDHVNPTAGKTLDCFKPFSRVSVSRAVAQPWTWRPVFGQRKTNDYMRAPSQGTLVRHCDGSTGRVRQPYPARTYDRSLAGQCETACRDAADEQITRAPSPAKR